MKITFYIIFIAAISFFGITSAYGQGGKKGVAPVTAMKKSVAGEMENKKFSIPEYFNGYNAQMLRGPSWQEPGFIQRVKELHPRLIRYPGGTVTSYWDWKAGWLKDEIEIRKEWRTIRRNPIRLEDLKFACDSTGAIPVFVLNMMTSDLNYQMEMLKHARKIGLPVKFVELENEVYLGEEFYVSKFPTGVDYANEANKWIVAIKKEFQDVKIGVVGFSSRESAAKKEKNHFARTSSWNRDVFSVIKNADAMVYHVYGGTGLNYFGGKNLDDDEEVNLDALQAIFDKPETTPVILGVPFQRWRNTNTYDYQILPDGMEAWITEYNLFEKEGVMAGTWVHGLYAFIQTIMFMENQRTGIICYHNLTTSAQFSAIFNNDQGFAKAVRKKANKPFDFTAAGHCLSLFGRAMKDGGDAVKLKFTVNPEIQAARGQLYPAMNGWVIKSKSGNKVIVANLSSEMIQTDFSKISTKNAVWSQVSGQPHTQVAGEADVKMTKGKGTTINLAPYSVTIIESE